LGDLCKLHILAIRVRSFIRTLKFDAEGKIVTAASALILGFTCVPGSLVKGDTLNRLACAIDQKMRRDAQMGNFVEIRMGCGIELVAEELFNICSAETAGGEADAMNNEEVNF